MFNLNIKNLLGWQISTLLITFALAIFGFLNFESVLTIKILMILIALFAIITSVGQEKINLLLIITLYLIFFDLYNLYLQYLWPLWVIMLCLIAFNALIFYLASHFQIMSIKKNLWFVYLLVFIIICLEIFLTLISWPIDPKGKAMILTSFFYLFWGLIFLEADQKLNFKKCLNYLLISGTIITVVILTSNWYGY